LLAAVVARMRPWTPSKASRAISIGVAFLGVRFVAGCSGNGVGAERVGATRSPIAYGTLDTRHTAVVALLSPVGTSELQECSGSIVAVTGGEGYVLTAAHCCNTYPPTIVVASNDYTVGEAYLSGGVPAAPVYAVVRGSVYYDASYDNAGGHDFCMLRFAGAGTGLATLELPTSASDGLQLGSQLEHVGFGITDTTTMNTQRRAGTDSLDQELTSLLLQFSQGGANHVAGTCEGDSGGPSLVPAGAAQSQQVITGVQSYGNASSCAQETLGVASRVASAIGSGQFITSYVAGTPIGVNAGGPGAPAPAGGLWTSVVLGAALMASGLRRGHLDVGDAARPR
jgi:secreted trypsin-like serine protease